MSFNFVEPEGLFQPRDSRTHTLKPLRVEPAHRKFEPLRPQKKAQLSLSFNFCGAGGIRTLVQT